jgi:hypothetical protein
MAEYIKILGQASGTTATAETTLNGWPDPNLEFYTTATNVMNSAPGPLFGYVGSYGSGANDNFYQHYNTNDHSPDSYNPSRTNSIRFSAHENNHRPYYRLSQTAATTQKPFLKAGQPYTLSLWAKFTGSYHGHEHHNRWSMRAYNGSSWLDVINRDGDSSMHQNGINYKPGWDSPVNNSNNIWNNWGRHYQTFTGQGGFFDFEVETWNHSYNEWTYLFLDSLVLIEGAIPRALLPRKAIDGSSGNPNALYTTPYTTRSEGWAASNYLSPTIRKVTGSWVNLYVVPDNRAAVASSIVISNIGTSSATYRIAVVKYGEALSHKSMLAFDHPIVQTSNETMTLGISLAAGDKIIVQSDTDKVQFQLFGSELTVG